MNHIFWHKPPQLYFRIHVYMYVMHVCLLYVYTIKTVAIHSCELTLKDFTQNVLLFTRHSFCSFLNEVTV